MKRLLAVAACARTVAAYGEGHAPVAPSAVVAPDALAFTGWSGAGFVEECGVVRPGRATAAVRVTLPADAVEWRSDEICVRVAARASSELAWWFVVPPPPSAAVRACAKTADAAAGGGETSVVAVAQLEEDLEVGAFAFVAAWLDQDPASTTRLPAAATAVFAVGEAAWGDFLPPVVPPALLARLVEAWDVVRDDERHEHLAYAERVRDAVGAFGAAPPSLATLEPWLDPALYAALADGSPAALWPLLEADGASNVAALRVLTPGGAAAVAEAVDGARPRLADAAPTNNMSRVTEDVHVAVSRVNAPEQPRSLLLDEVGLGALAQALAAHVLAPLSLLLFPGVGQGALDSMHAFTLHRRPEVDRSNATASVHNDVCETSLNFDLRVEDLGGSRVVFYGDDGSERWLGHAAGAGFVNVCRDQHGVEPAVRGSRDTAVLRGFAAAFRRSPGETYRERCLPPSIW